MPAVPLPTVAVDLRALVPEATGIGVYTRSLLACLAASGRFRYLGLAHREPRGAGDLQRAGVAVEHQPAPLGVLWQQLQLPRRLSRGDVDLFWSPLMTLPLGADLPSVVTIHDLTALLFPEAHRLKVRWSLYPFLERSLDQARRIVAVSHATAADLRFHFPSCADRIRVVHEGVDPAFHPAAPNEIQGIREHLGLPDGYILYIGTLEPRKNVPILLAAWESLKAGNPNIPPLVLAGDRGWGNRALLRRIESMRSLGLQALGRVDDATLVRLLQGATLFVYPSLYEGFGLPPLEAMACGIPTIVSDAASLPEIVGDAALKVSPTDAGALSDAMHLLLTNPTRAADLAHRGIERARHFTWEKAAREMEEVFEEALQPG
jgi:glycosyltransferase involved in cell wall biosynthesis